MYLSGLDTRDSVGSWPWPRPIPTAPSSPPLLPLGDRAEKDPPPGTEGAVWRLPNPITSHTFYRAPGVQEEVFGKRWGCQIIVYYYYYKLSAAGCQATEFCHNERFEKTCLPGSVVVMTIARYGIMNMSRCVDRDYGYVGCATDVMAQADRLCSGRAACTIAVPNSDLDNLQRMCPKDLKSYLTAEATCWPGKFI